MKIDGTKYPALASIVLAEGTEPNPAAAKKAAKDYLTQNKIKFSKISAKTKYSEMSGRTLVTITVEGIETDPKNPTWVKITDDKIQGLKAELKKHGATVVLYSDSGMSLGATDIQAETDGDTLAAIDSTLNVIESLVQHLQTEQKLSNTAVFDLQGKIQVAKNFL